jgi:MaoC like domain
MDMIENRTFDEMNVGDTASLVRTLSRQDIELFAVMSGDINPAHVDVEYARSDMFHKIIAHGMWGASLISTVLGTKLPGPGAIYARVIAPTEKVKRPRTVLPEVRLRERGLFYRHLISLTAGLSPIRTAIVHPVDENALLGAIEAAQANLIVPVLIGPAERIKAVADAHDVDLSAYEMIPTYPRPLFLTDAALNIYPDLGAKRDII